MFGTLFLEVHNSQLEAILEEFLEDQKNSNLLNKKSKEFFHMYEEEKQKTSSKVSQEEGQR